ncbi:MAG: FKBP-type peptidyl-prolyl cis-trans isomerase [Lachnospiraceae bacterium]
MKDETVVLNETEKEAFETKDGSVETDKNIQPKKNKTPLLVLGAVCIVAIIGVVVYLVLDGMGIIGNKDKVKKLADYKNFTYDAYDPTVTDEDVTEYYEYLVELYVSQFTSVGYVKDDSRDGTQVKDGDTVNIDYTGYIDGEAFENGADTDYNLTIGSGAFIDGFESSLIGKNFGETVDINVTFPDPYPNNPDMAGVDAVFTVKINYIAKEVDITVDNAYDLMFGYDTKEEMFEVLKTNLEADSASGETSYINSKQNEYITYIVENSEFEDLTKEAQDYADKIFEMIENAATSNNIEVATYIKNYYGYSSVEEYKSVLLESCILEKKQDYVINKIAEIENITMSDKDFKELATSVLSSMVSDSSSINVEEYETGYDEQYGKGAFRQYMFDIYVTEKLFDMYAKEIPAVATGATAQ